jgi:hypothetical protein
MIWGYENHVVTHADRIDDRSGVFANLVQVS